MTRWQRFTERCEESFLPRRRFPRSSHAAWFRATLLVWSSLGMMTVLGAVALVAPFFDRGHLARSALLAAIAALILVARHRVAPAPRAHGHMLLALLLCAAGLVDVASGGMGLAAVAIAPLLVLLAIVLVPRVDVAAWVGVALLGVTLAAVFGRADPRQVALLPALAAGLALAGLVGARIAHLCTELVRSTDEAGIDALSAHDAERRDRDRFDSFVALPGDWYWETEVDLTLSFLSPGFAARFGLVDGAALGHAPEDVIRAAFPDAHGTEELARIMRQRLEFSAQLVGWTGADGRAVLLRLNGWPAHAGNGLFLGYRGGAREVAPAEPAVAPVLANAVAL